MKNMISEFPAVVVLTGASGAGKTSLILRLNEIAVPGIAGFNCDRALADIRKSVGEGDVQSEILQFWISELEREQVGLELAVLDTQVRPHVAQQVLDRAGVLHSRIILVDCDPAVRNERLCIERRQPELANARMDCWAAYLRGQADALGLAVIETGEISVDEGVDKLLKTVRELLEEVRAA